MKRKIYDKLLDWKNKRNGKTAVLIEGARRIGKTYTIEEFAKNEYKSYILIDFSKVSQDVINVFENDIDDLDIFFNKIKIIYNVELYKRNSLVIFDEVQLYPKARQLIKHLVADGRYDFAETGSLISLQRNVKDILIPSEEEKLYMYPMDFEEFLWAMNWDATYEYIKDCYEHLKPLGQSIHKVALKQFREYMLVGGMPKVVDTYANEKNFENVEFEKQQILNLYLDDINKFANGERSKAKLVFNSIPSQLQKKNKKINYSELKNNSRNSEFENTFIFLEESMMVNLCYNVTDPAYPLILSEDISEKKCYMHDTGLLITACLKGDQYIHSDIYKNILLDKLSINEGMFMENIVAQAFRASNKKLFFYKKSDREKRENEMEIDFLIERQGKICPVEVKSSVYKKHSSLDKFRLKFKKQILDSYIFYQKDVMIRDDIIHLPLYMAGLVFQ